METATEPAVEGADGTQEWWLNGKQLSEAEWLKAVSPVKELTVKEVEKKHNPSFYNFFITIGNLLTVLLFFMVIKSTNLDWNVLFWMIPLIMLIEFGCLRIVKNNLTDNN